MQVAEFCCDKNYFVQCCLQKNIETYSVTYTVQSYPSATFVIERHVAKEIAQRLSTGGYPGHLRCIRDVLTLVCEKNKLKSGFILSESLLNFWHSGTRRLTPGGYIVEYYCNFRLSANSDIPLNGYLWNSFFMLIITRHLLSIWLTEAEKVFHN